MWVHVYRSVYPGLLNSERKYVDIGKSDLARNTLTIGTSVIYIIYKALHFNTVRVLYMLCINTHVPCQSSVCLCACACVCCMCMYVFHVYVHTCMFVYVYCVQL